MWRVPNIKVTEACFFFLGPFVGSDSREMETRRGAAWRGRGMAKGFLGDHLSLAVEALCLPGHSLWTVVVNWCLYNLWPAVDCWSLVVYVKIENNDGFGVHCASSWY